MVKGIKDMDILGISCFYHDSAACFVRNGKIIASAQERRNLSYANQ
jgi:carbamoyltransferase